MPSWGKLKDLVRVGLPCAANFLCDLLVWAVFVNLLIGKMFGTEHLIATNTAWQYMRVAFLPVFGAGQALQALVGKSIGAGNPQRAMQETRVAVRMALGYLGALSAVYAVFGATLIGWFNATPEVVRIGYGVMICAACFQLFDGLGIIYGAALRGAGDTFIPSMFFIGSSWLIIVGGGWTVATRYPQFGSLGPWVASSTLIALVGVFLWWRWRGGAWRKIALFGEANTTS
jgi:MATE family multidrug resistance protein